MFFGRKKRRSKVAQEYSEKMILSENSPFLMREDYKALRTNVGFAFPGQKSICIAVTSGDRGEGKSTTSINLALSFAQLGKRVLLVDCDMRLPTVAVKLGLGKVDRGLTDFLMGSYQLDEVLMHAQTESLSVLCVGTIPADPTRLLSSEIMGNFLQEMKKQYDYIILDCPPVNMVIDACVMAPFVDGYLLVVSHAQSEHDEISNLLYQMERANANIIGFVYTKAPADTQKYYKKYGKYGYSYGYGYGHSRHREKRGKDRA